jgi:HSP20 family protein
LTGFSGWFDWRHGALPRRGKQSTHAASSGASLQVQLEQETLTLSAERKPQARGERDSFHRMERTHGVLRRSFVLPSTVDADKVEARYEAGVLTVTLPKREETRPRAIAVQVG